MVGRKKVSRSATTELKENMVYIPPPRRTEWIPNISPECLKLETWLRMKQIPYEHLDAEAMTGAGDSQLPYCKINGKELPYSIHMLCEIGKSFNKEMPDCDDESAVDNGSQRAFEGLIEGSLNWVWIYMRATQADQLPPFDVFQGRFWQFLRPFANKFAANKLKTKADYQGIGRQNATDVLATGKQDLRAISAYLGDKAYFGQEEPNKLDATAFAHLCQFWYIPIENELKTYIKEKCPNLIAYMEGIKGKYWPDWEENCRKPTPSRRSKSKDEQSQAVNEEKQQKPEAISEGDVPAVNGCKEEGENKNEEKPKLESTVEIIKPATPEEKKESTENGVTEEHKPEATS